MPAILRLAIVMLLGAAAVPAARAAEEPGRRDPGASAETQARGDAAEERREFAVQPGSTLDLSNISGEVRITAGPDGAIVVQAVRRGTDRSADEPRLETTQVGNRVEVRARGSRSGRTRGSIDLTVTVPADAAVAVRSVSGGVDLTGVTGDVRLESVSGSIVLAKAGNVALAKSVSGSVTIRDSASTGTLMLSSVSGAVLANGVRASALEASSVSGAIRLSAVAAERVGAKTVSGVVEFGGPLAGGGRYELTSHSGDVVVRLPAGADFDLAADTFSGRLTSDFPVTLRSSRGGPTSRTIRGVAGDGGAQLVVRSFSGSVTIGRQ
jgi:hypothetical protein